jgi:hypothetical protein
MARRPNFFAKIASGQMEHSNSSEGYTVIDTEGIIRDRIEGENPQQSIVGRLKDKLQKMMPQG